MLSRPPHAATVVGSGPNGLAAALVLARAGVKVTVVEAADTAGGGLRSSTDTHGVRHDHCATTFPLAQASPFFREFGQALAGHGLELATAPVDAVHVLDTTRSATLHTSVADTAAGLPGTDGRIWQAFFGPLGDPADRAAKVTDEFLRPILHVPRHPLLFAGFGVQAGLPASWSWRRFRSPETRALLAGIMAHAFTPLNLPGSSAAGTLLTVAGHAHGWPVAVGGSQSMADAMLAELAALGGSVVTGMQVTDVSQVSGADVLLLDTSVEDAARILGDRVPDRVARSWRRFHRGPAVAKVDYTIEDGIPWSSPDARRAATVHLSGTADQVAAAEKDCWQGRLPRRPFTLVGQPWLADPGRTVVYDNRQLNPVWAYAHVPAGWTGTAQDTFDLVTAQIEDAAPGFRDHVVDWSASDPARVEATGRNNIGGDISGGANDLVQLLARPRLLRPYDTGVPGVFLCSSSTAPGGGVHFMCGMNAADRCCPGAGAGR
ncbi:phytoene desaturase family protein [Corynebacterium variabile]|uniref:phytoene desaturase family protein n=1 Tax=Corynebacterium variabile TaxID=1727 RepID=UPI003F95B8B5